VIPKGFILTFRNGFAPVKIFYAIPSPFFSAAAELRALTSNLCHLASVPMIARLSNPLEKSCSIHPHRLTASDSLEKRIVMAKSSMVASTISKNPIYHRNRDASIFFFIAFGIDMTARIAHIGLKLLRRATFSTAVR
jgi:hypothetical protein